MNKILITGGSGFVGRALTQEILNKSQQVYNSSNINNSNVEIFWLKSSSKPIHNPKGISPQRLDTIIHKNNPKIITDLSNLSQPIDIVINLAGETIAQRWTKRSKKRILESRISTTANIVNWIKSTQPNLKLLISASASGYYSDRGEESIDESSIVEDDSCFTNVICRQWENEAFQAYPNTKVAIIRLGVVLGKNGGALQKLISTTRIGAGYIGSGQQWNNWIHIEDAVKSILFIIDKSISSDKLDKSIWNLNSPNNVRAYQMTKSLRTALKCKFPIQTNMPKWAANILLGEMSSLMTNSTNIYPRKLIDEGFIFKFANIDDAIAHLVK